MKAKGFEDRIATKRQFTIRIIIALLVVTTLFGLLITRLVFLQVVGFETYATRSRDNRLRLEAVPPIRGRIYDRNGVILAENVPSYGLEVTLENVTDLNANLAALQKIIQLDKNDLERFHRTRKYHHRYQPIPLKFGLSEAEVSRFAALRPYFEGFDIRARFSRHYPQGTLTSHVVGYVGRLDEDDLKRVNAANYSGTTHYGKTGAERYYEDILHGQAGYQRLETNAVGRRLRVVDSHAPIPGKDLHLTLDVKLQAAAEASLGEHDGAIIAIDPNNGELLAMVSRPTFDPNLFVNGISVADYAELRNHPGRPLFNRAIQGQYPPGSTIKPFMGLAALEYGLVNKNNSLKCKGFYTLPNNKHKYRDWKRWGHQTTNLHKAIVESCDVYFYNLAYNLGIDRLHDYLGQFGMGKYTGIDIPREANGLIPSREWKRANKNEQWFPGETLITGIGQGFMLATPLQVATATAMLANRGYGIKPHVILGTSSADSERIDYAPATAMHYVEASDYHWAQIIDAMTKVVHGKKGTGRGIAEGISYQMAGKTGTAQVFSLSQDEEKPDFENLDKKLRDHALFIAFAPVKQPRIAVMVIAENGGSGGRVAAPIARGVIDYYLTGKRYQPIDDATPPSAPATPAQPNPPPTHAHRHQHVTG